MTIRTSLLALLSYGALLLSAGARADFAPSAEAAIPLAVGQMAPDFTAQHADGSTYRFDAKHLRKPTVLLFYRGGWCPFCNGQLADMHEVEPKLKATGFDVIFVSTDRPALLYSSLKDQSISYTLLSDPHLNAARAFHIAYHLDDALYAKQLSYGVDLEKTTGTLDHALPVPSVFIVDKSGVVQFRYSNPDFRVRLSAEDLWKAAASLATY